MKQAVLYARVSRPDLQDTEDKISIEQQLTDQRSLCERNEWRVVAEFVDNEPYKAAQSPSRGKIVNPSGERSDRPRFLKMLEVVKTGEIDAVLCWRDDRLVRHPRVAVALEDALDLGDTRRDGKGKIEIRDATGALIDRFTLSIKATIWREENKRRVERTRMGKVATLQQGRYPGQFRAFGYVSIKEPGQRGRRIEIVEEEAIWVRRVCAWFSGNVPVYEIRRRLIAEGVQQTGVGNRRHEWGHPQIYNMVRAEYYAGQLAWRFGDGTEYIIEIPPIIDRKLWEQNQKRIERNKHLSPRNARGIYLLQGLLQCGECGRTMHAERQRYYYRKGQKRLRGTPRHVYRCPTVQKFPDEPHPYPCYRSGGGLDWAVWRHIVDCGIKQPNLICAQVQRKQAELQAQGDNVTGDISHAMRRLTEVDNERAFYQRQAARGKMTEFEFDARMEETKGTREYWQLELKRLKELRDSTERVQAGLDYATTLLTALQDRLAEIDVPPDELKALPDEMRDEILKERREIIRALVDRVVIYASGKIEIEGVLDGSEAAQFELAVRQNDLLKLTYRLLFNMEVNNC